MVVAGGDVGNQGAERVERGFEAMLQFFIHIGAHALQRHVAGAFDHHLHIMLPGFGGEFA